MRKGFTIVELLIVIVVIAILAAISIVAYNGFQLRANESIVKSDLAMFHKIVGLFHAENGNYPKDATELNTIRAPFTKSAYYTTDQGNVTYCTSTNGTAYALLARGIGTKRFYISSFNTLQEFVGTYGTPTAMCTSLGMSYSYGSWGYEPNISGWGTPGWKIWTAA